MWETALAVLTVVLAVIVPLLAVIWRLLNEKIREHKEACDKDVSVLWDQIGRDSDTGMRKRVHQSVSMGPFVDLERRVYEIEKHLKP